MESHVRVVKGVSVSVNQFFEIKVCWNQMKVGKTSYNSGTSKAKLRCSSGSISGSKIVTKKERKSCGVLIGQNSIEGDNNFEAVVGPFCVLSKKI